MAAALAAALAAAAAITAQPIADPDVLEPSVWNEVDRALAVAPTNTPSPGPAASAAFREETLGTNRLDATALAIRLVSAQRADGRWYAGTNDVTALAVRMLEELSR